MPALFVFLLKVNIALLLFCAGYYLVLRHLTFYTLNRVYLVGAILFASMYPQINLNNFAQHHQQLARPVQMVVLNLQAPAETLVKPIVQPVYWHWAEIVFFIGAAFLAMRLLMQLFSLYKLHRSSIPMKIRDHDVRVIHGNDGPFSFWQSIYINPAKHGETDLKSILKHEQIHVDEWHTLDILLAEISTIFYWFNPGIWLMKKAVRENIEFITDRKILKNGIDSKQYQYSLVNVSFAAAPQSIVNHFNLSTIKKRIIMMNAKKSSNANLTRYALVVPAVLICLLTFSFSKAELIKKSTSTYKAITLSVDKITRIAAEKLDAKYVTTLFEQNDTVKRLKIGLTDTNKIKFVVLDGTYKYRFNMDTGKMIRLTVTDSGRAVKMLGASSPITMINNIRMDSNRISKVRLNGKDMGITVYNKYQVVTKYLDITTDTNKKIPTIHIKDNDSVIYIVDGKKMNYSNFKNITPGDIQRIDVLKNNSGVIMITTNTNHDNKTVTGYAIGSTKDVLLSKMTGLSVAANGTVTRDTVNYKSTNFGKPQLVTVRGYQGSQLKELQLKSNNETNIDNLSAKLVFIDGKEASQKELKKLSAADIKSMSAKSGDDMVKQYGDKAKSGVLFISTKNSK